MDHPINELQRLLQGGRKDLYGYRDVGKVFDEMAKNVKNKNYEALEKDFEELENAIISKAGKTVATALFKKADYLATKRSLLVMDHTQSAVGGKSIVNFRNKPDVRAAYTDRQSMLDLSGIAESVNTLTGALIGSHNAPGQESTGYLPIPMTMTEDNMLRIQTHIESLQSEVERLMESYKELQDKSKQDAEPRIRQDLLGEIDRLRQENHRLTDDLHKAIAKMDYWIARLSSIAGAKLEEGNHAITDFSDPNRPQKLAERFAELYDSEWTDAMELLTSCNVERETEAIRNLAALLKENKAMTISIEVKCGIRDLQRKAAIQAREAVFKAKVIAKVKWLLMRTRKAKNEVEQERRNGYEEAERKNLDPNNSMDGHCRRSLMCTENCCLKLENDKKELYTVAKSIPEFVHKSFEICWMVTLHNPPLCFFWPDTSKDQTMDHNMFTCYTRPGVTIDYVVWPAMLLHEGGPLLRKGVAQPIGKNANK